MEIRPAHVTINGQVRWQFQRVLPRTVNGKQQDWVAERWPDIDPWMMDDDAERRRFWTAMFATLTATALRDVEEVDGAVVQKLRAFRPGERSEIEREIATHVAAPTDEEMKRWRLKTVQKMIEDRERINRNISMTYAPTCHRPSALAD